MRNCYIRLIRGRSQMGAPAISRFLAREGAAVCGRLHCREVTQAPGGRHSRLPRSVLQYKHDDDCDEDSHDEGEPQRTEYPQPAPCDDAGQLQRNEQQGQRLKEAEPHGLDLFLLVHVSVPFSVVVGRCVVVRPGLHAVVTVAERLPVALIPEQRPVTSVRNDVVYVSRLDVPAFLHALHTQRMCFQVFLPCFLPCPCVSPRTGASHFLRMHRFVNLTVFGSVWYERRTAGMPAWCLWS